MNKKQQTMDSKQKTISRDQESIKKQQNSISDIVNTLLKNRGVKTVEEKKDFLNSDINKITPELVGISKEELKKTIKRINSAIKNKEQIVVFGDYDADGLCASAILWETLNKAGAKVLPYIPSRLEEGYGLSKTSILNLKSKILNPKLIITVDNGITANEAVEFAIKEGIDVIITDHHLLPKKLPKAYSIIHTTKLAGVGVAWILAHEFKVQDSKLRARIDDNYLDLVAIATVADLVPLVGANRALVKFGLEALRNTKRVGLLELFEEAGIEISEIGTYKIGHIVVPRLNAAGRIGDALDSLRLLCTKDKKRAQLIAGKLGLINRERQVLTEESTENARTIINNQKTKNKEQNLKDKKLILVSDESYRQGIIGLIAGRLSEEFYRPAIVISKGKIISKASARSVKGFNIIEFIRNVEEFLVNAGGHPMAAGFTVETVNLPIIEKKFHKLAEKLIKDSHLIRKQRIDCKIPLSIVSDQLYEAIKKLEPFGMGNPLPVFESIAVIEDMRNVGQDSKHLRLKFKVKSEKLKVNSKFSSKRSSFSEAAIIDGIGFGIGEISSKLSIGETVNVIYSLDQNVWNGDKRLQLKIKNIS